MCLEDVGSTNPGRLQSSPLRPSNMENPARSTSSMVWVALAQTSSFSLALRPHSSSSRVFLSLSFHFSATRCRACTRYHTPTESRHRIHFTIQELFRPCGWKIIFADREVTYFWSYEMSYAGPGCFSSIVKLFNFIHELVKHIQSRSHELSTQPLTCTSPTEYKIFTSLCTSTK